MTLGNCLEHRLRSAGQLSYLAIGLLEFIVRRFRQAIRRERRRNEHRAFDRRWLPGLGALARYIFPTSLKIT